jgi:hypothetical protein
MPNDANAKLTENIAGVRTTRPLLGTVSPGVMLVLVREQAPMHIVRAALERQMIIRGRIAGLPLPKMDRVISILTGNHRDVEAMKLAASYEHFPAGAAVRKLQVLGTSGDFDVCCDEGMCAVSPFVAQARTLVTALLPSKAASSPHFVSGLERYRAATKKAGSFVMLFMCCGPKQDVSWVRPHCDEVVEVAECEPNPNIDYAFSVDSGLRLYLPPTYITKVMFSVTWTKRGWIHRQEPFVAASVEDRLIWWMLREGETQSTIADVLGVNKATVSRHVSRLKQTLKSKTMPREGWREDFPEYFSADDGEEICESEDDFASDFEGVDE